MVRFSRFWLNLDQKRGDLDRFTRFGTIKQK